MTTDACIANACLNFSIPFQQGWQMTTVFYLLPQQEVAHPLQVLLCQRPTSMATLSPGSQPPRSHLYKLIICHSETPAMRASSFHRQCLLFKNSEQRINILHHFLLLSLLMEQALQDPGCLTCKK